VTSDDAALTVGTGPTITQQPSAQGVCAGGTATFTVAATGLGTLTYQWQKDGVDLVDGGDISGATTTTLQIADVEAADAGNYHCVVTGDCGGVTSADAALTIQAATVITQQPSPQDLCPGDTATFTVAATGEGTLTYQWQRNGVDLVDGGDISGATATTLQIANVKAADAGNYHCVVTGDCGSATSDDAALTILPVRADLDVDGDVDGWDFLTFSTCYNGSLKPPRPECPNTDADLDGDGDVDGWDFLTFSTCYNGALNPPRPGCPCSGGS
jgi:hypothetical protein